MAQQRLLRGLRCFRDEHAAAAVGRGDKTRSHVVAEERKLCDVGPSLIDKMPPTALAAIAGSAEARVWVLLM
jgi:hypothetical protein